MVLCKLVLLFLLIGVAYVAHEITKVPPMPHIPDTYWGKGNPKPDDVGIYPFSINVSQTVLNDLKTRIRSTNALTPPLEGVGFQYGFNSDYLKVVLDYWANNYNWRKFENAINRYPQYKTQISGLNIHFLRVAPKVPASYKVYPLLLLHGWPGSIKEFQKIIPLLTTPRTNRDFAFEVIAPSLPGYAWSDAAVRPGLGAAQMALLFKKLMIRLGHNEFYVQGGDWGAIIAANMATLYPENVKGLHSNMCITHTALATLKHLIGAIYPPLVVEEKYADRMYPISKIFNFMMEESGYFHIQATKPDTVGVALSDSPAGLAAYILEKFSTGTNPSYRDLPDGGLTQNLHLDDMLDDVSVYWITGSMTSAMRIYSEVMGQSEESWQLRRIPTHVPTACIMFPHEISYQSAFILKEKYRNLIQNTHPARGGHFAALEEPEVLADDVWEFLSQLKRIEQEAEEERKRDEEVRRKGDSEEL